MEQLTQFLTQSPHQLRKIIDLCGCSIGDNGISIFHQELTKHNVIIEVLSLSTNKLTELSAWIVYRIAIHCKVRKLSLRHNPSIAKDPRLYLMISDPCSMLEEVNISHTNLKQSSTAAELFSEVEKSSKKEKLRVLSINGNNITDNDSYSAVKAIQNNTSLTQLNLHTNEFSVTTALQIIQSLTYNNTLEVITLPWYQTNDQERIVELAREVDKHRYCKTSIYYR